MSDIESLASSLAELSLHSEHQPTPQSLHEKTKDASTDENSTPAVEKSDQNQKAAAGDCLESVKSRRLAISSVRSLNRVPKSERRGLLSWMTIMPEYQDPRNYRRIQKFIIVCVVAFAGVAGPMGTSILLPAVKDLSTELDTTIAMVNVSVGIYIISLGVFPMWWSNFSEKHGRRSVFVVSFAWFFAFTIGCAWLPRSLP